MRDNAVKFYLEGSCNCAQCLLKAAEIKYSLGQSDERHNMAAAMNTGFGVGGLCCVFVAAMMIFGLLFDENTAKRLRLKMFMEFLETHDRLDCAHLIREKVGDSVYCEGLIGELADLIDRIILEEQINS